MRKPWIRQTRRSLVELTQLRLSDFMAASPVPPSSAQRQSLLGALDDAMVSLPDDSIAMVAASDEFAALKELATGFAEGKATFFSEGLQQRLKALPKERMNLLMQAVASFNVPLPPGKEQESLTALLTDTLGKLAEAMSVGKIEEV